MKSKLESVVNILAAATWADNTFQDEERATVREIADEYGFTPMIF